MKDFFAFRTMITPSLVQIIFVIGLIILLVLGVAGIIQGLNPLDTKAIASSVLLLLFGPLVLRFYLEIIVVLFRIHDTMKDVHQTLQNQSIQPSQPKVLVEDESSKL